MNTRQRLDDWDWRALKDKIRGGEPEGTSGFERRLRRIKEREGPSEMDKVRWVHAYAAELAQHLGVPLVLLPVVLPHIPENVSFPILAVDKTLCRGCWGNPIKFRLLSGPGPDDVLFETEKMTKHLSVPEKVPFDQATIIAMRQALKHE
jgi:hypothetical protein